ncbi:vacuolar protein sorting-associated protein 37A isoform X2 [Stigmatopora nigra]
MYKRVHADQRESTTSFLANGGSGPQAPLNNLQQQRQRQIETLQAAHPSISEIQKDVEYRIPFTVNKSIITFNILLPPQFPQEKPVVSIYPPVGHPLIDSKNGTLITSPLITNFGMHSDLGKVIQSLLDEFWKSPPTLLSTGQSGFTYMHKPLDTPPYPPPSYHYGLYHVGQRKTPPLAPFPSGVGPGLHPGVESVHGSHRQPDPYGLITDLVLPVPVGDLEAGLKGQMYKMPEIPASFSELSELNLTQLSDLSEKEDDLLRFFVTLPQLKIVSSDKEELVTNIVKMANRNLMMEPRLEGKRRDIIFKFEQLTQLKSVFETKIQKQHDLKESRKVSTLQSRLKVAAHQAEEDSEGIADTFLEGLIDIDEFLICFLEKRMLCHSRRAKEEKLQQSIQTQEQFTSTL